MLPLASAVLTADRAVKRLFGECGRLLVNPVLCEFQSSRIESFDRKIEQRNREKVNFQFSLNIAKKISDAGTAYNFDNIDVDGNPEVQFKSLKRMVGPRGRFSNFSADARRLTVEVSGLVKSV